MSRFALIFTLVIASAGSVSSQVTNRENYDFKQPSPDARECARLFQVYRAIPQELRINTFIRQDTAFIVLPGNPWLAQILESKNDGVSIDLVQKSQYQCDNITRLSTSWSHKGFLLPPLYRDDVKRRLRNTSQGAVFVPVGKLPRQMKPEDVEANFILLEDKFLCAYSSIVNIDFQGWKLLRMGLYYDTLSAEKMEERYRELKKDLRFIIPFEKNKATYKESDVKGLYDSLRLTDYAIQSISIRAYTSVEGTTERNTQLQLERAQSLVAALQTYQPEKIQSTIQTNENWVEFLDDVVAFHPDWLSLSKEEIKEKLKSPNLLADLEPILRNHRKGIVEIHLEKRLSYRESDPNELRKYFEETIRKKDLDEALYLQQIIFNKVERQELPDEYVKSITIPESLDYGSLLLNREAFQYTNGFSTVFEAIDAFTRLERIIPKNPHLQYNLCALRLQAWMVTDLIDDGLELKADIQKLESQGIHSNLALRLLVNYHILMSEKYMRKQKFAAKDQTLKFILDTYRGLTLNDNDLVNLAKYFCFYSRFDWAEQLLQPRIKALDVSEDLVYYYISLTIINRKNTSDPNYRVILLNAINVNPNRFCKQFNSSAQEGISFQLLDDAFLRKTYCETCK